MSIEAALPSRIIYVNQNAPSTSLNNGTSWANAYRELRDALNGLASAPPSVPVEVWVARGTYKPTAEANRSASFRLVSHVHIVGGFEGTETTLGPRKFSNIAVTNNTAENAGAIFSVGDGATSSVLQNNVTYNNPGSGSNVVGLVLNGGESIINPELDFYATVDFYGTVTLSVLPSNSTLRVIAAMQGAAGSVTFADKTVTYTQNGPPDITDAFSFIVTNTASGDFYTGVVHIVVVDVPHPPVASDDLVFGYRGYTTIINVLDNDSDLDHDLLTIVSATPARYGFVI